MNFDQLMAYLESNGFDILRAGGNCPVQVEANHKSGWSFCFRVRWDQAQIDVYDCPVPPGNEFPEDQYLLWSGWVRSWEWPNAGWLSPEEYGYILLMLLADARDWIS